jgi:pimeloyl-ACP methyl ester carboxylesterase
MNVSLGISGNRTIVRRKSSIRSLVRVYFALASRLLPRVARRHAEHLFTSPPRYAGRRVQPVDARRDTVVAGKHLLAVWQAGPAWAPAVLLVHGWGGRGLQMGGFVSPLLAAGYRVVWFDQPGHGENPRRAVGLPDFVRAVEALVTTHGPMAATIGHSLGAAALGMALRRRIALGRVVFVSAPSSIDQHAYHFARLLGITPQVREAMRRRLEQRYGVPFAEIDRIEDLERVRVRALFVHDLDDAEVRFEHTLRLSQRMPGARLLKTYGLGHYRLLRDATVIAAVVDFVRGDLTRLPVEVPALPRPAPLY